MAATPVYAARTSMTAEVDGRDLPRKLLHTRMEFQASGKTLDLWYPKWIPGIHGPRGPIRNVTGLRFEDKDGDSLTWRRDEADPFLLHVDVSGGAGKVVAYLDYICSQPTVNSRGVDSYGNSLIGIINWNTCLLYPDGYTSSEIDVDLSLDLPDGWRYATSLEGIPDDSGTLHFKTDTFHNVIDSPLITGEHFRTIKLDTQGVGTVYFHLTSESPSAIQIGEELEGHYADMATEAGALFGGAHYETYHLLVVCSDDFPSTGLEHLRSSLNGVGERDLLEEKELQAWVGYLIPHEFAHSWCGKYRRPAGMATPDFHTPKDTKLLWVYEGLDQYLGEVLTVRCGLWKLDRHKQALALKISGLMHQQGRRWRPLEDTAADAYHLRGGSAAWGNLRRGQDYYNEGLLLWMEADAIIRQETDGRKSLDDFCEAFMGPQLPEVEVHPFELEDLVDALNGVVEYDWEPFITDWVSKPQEALPLEFVERLGYRLQYSAEPSEYLKDREKDRDYVSAMDSLGISVVKEGEIGGSVVPGMPGDAAGLTPGMIIVGVNGYKYTGPRLKDALADSITKREIELLILQGDVFKTIHVPYADGPKYLELVRNEDKPDILADIFAPRVTTNDD